MRYHIHTQDPTTHFFEISCTIENLSQSSIEIQLPAWRPGRYQLQHFAKNIQRFEVVDPMGFVLPFHKITKDRWLVETVGHNTITVRYNYYANLQNAGSSYLDAHLWYINPVNLCVYADGHLHEPCTLTLDLPEGYKIACGLPKNPTNTLFAKDYYELVDSPLMASAALQCRRYEVGNVHFYVWIEGNITPDWNKIIGDFQRFSEEQILTMGRFPETDFHFLNLILPTPYYHGVEHRHSTVIVLGPDHEPLYDDLLGVSSHELFHAWNVIRIRPKELLPYDFTKENYFTTCFVVEGVTTYYGDLFLRRAGVIDDESYQKELLTYLKRHFEASRHASQSLAESSYDLWLDGYDAGIPDRKVSVYQKGALVALILDLNIRRLHQHKRSLDDVMRVMWDRFGTPFVGYTYDDYVKVVEEIAGQPLNWYWRDCILGNVPLDDHLNEVLPFVGLTLKTDPDGAVHLILDEDNAAATTERQRWLGSCRNHL
jgi:predicted metalloprotease with PDZ domain